MNSSSHSPTRSRRISTIFAAAWDTSPINVSCTSRRNSLIRGISPLFARGLERLRHFPTAVGGSDLPRRPTFLSYSFLQSDRLFPPVRRGASVLGEFGDLTAPSPTPDRPMPLIPPPPELAILSSR
ncbi:UNVERIFIED_CONTAM: hypothetical protein Sradi_0453000 [Sesamum radiatum]|uniref:Uncharacterized protein n=1 Tax=Sesamum radiatum TaxID=300843 RepID=A0AAW2W898_SESRA